MGWTFTLGRTSGSYKELFIQNVLYSRLETEDYKYISIKQVGASVVNLFYHKHTHKYYIECYLLQKDRQYGFGYKDISWTDAPYKAIPKSWLNKVEQTESVLEYKRLQEAYLNTLPKKPLPTYKSLIGKRLEVTLNKELHYDNGVTLKNGVYKGEYRKHQGLILDYNYGYYGLPTHSIKKFVSNITVV